MSNQEQSGQLHFAALMAHQLRSPLDAALSQMEILLEGYAGKLTAEQRDLLERVRQRCREAMDAGNRVLAIARAAESAEPPSSVADLSRAVRNAERQYAGAAIRRKIQVRCDTPVEPVWVRASEDELSEVCHALLNNAFKYTPDHGHVRLSVAPGEDTKRVRFTVEDSGIGIPESEREAVFRPFVRTQNVSGSSTPGVGLGLPFVHAMIGRAGGRVWAERSDLGGARIVADMPAGPAPETAMGQGAPEMTAKLRVVIVGGVAAGPKVASKIIRLQPEAEVTILEKGKFLSYAGCGLPYYVSGVVKEQAELMSTPAGAVRDPVFFQKVKNVVVHNGTEAVEIDRENKRIRARNLASGEETWLEYDYLVLATGATPVKPPVPGIELENVFTLHGVNDAEGIRHLLSKDKAQDVVVIGGGLIGVEVTEALVEKGCRVTMVELADQILGMLDWEMAQLVEQHMESRGVKVMTNTTATLLEGEGGKVKRVVTNQGVLPVDMVIMGIGVRPNVALAKQAGLEIGRTGAIKVDDHLRTSDPNVFAVGDCAENVDLITGEPSYVPLGSTANKHGRVAAINICGGQDTYPGILGSAVCKVFDFCVGRTGLTERQARAGGFDVITVHSPAPDRAHYMPTVRPLMMKLVVERTSRKLLGLQAVGPGAGDKRVDIAAMAITAGMTVDQLAKVDLCYAPPYSPAMDNIITAADIARNKLSGAMNGITAREVHELMQKKDAAVFLDVRSPGEFEQVRLPGSLNIPLGALRGRLHELDKDKPIVAFCKISLRGYEAGLILKHAGFKDVRVLDGGIAMWPYEKVQ
ncbi:MAG TPA: FAD-dependent oxidoreductase [Candidatus Hydrogenedentes bacterium]|nr:FAD-dependent oxidoreductase [Candidatus Hydrogenedentota bacterium]